MSITPHVQASSLLTHRGLAVPLAHTVDFGTARSSYRSDEQFVTMLNGYRYSGGLARAQEVAALCLTRGGPATHLLAQWMFKRSVISFEWQSGIWLPLFQFNHADMSRRLGLESALSELTLVYDNWDDARWFSQPNAWLGDHTPADALAAAAPDVLNAARADRYAAAG